LAKDELLAALFDLVIGGSKVLKLVGLDGLQLFDIYKWVA